MLNEFVWSPLSNWSEPVVLVGFAAVFFVLAVLLRGRRATPTPQEDRA